MNRLNPHDEFVELSNAIGILDNMDAGVYSVIETQWGTTCSKFCKYIWETLKHKDKYTKAAFSSNMDESFLISWKTRRHHARSIGAVGLQGCEYR